MKSSITPICRHPGIILLFFQETKFMLKSQCFFSRSKKRDNGEENKEILRQVRRHVQEAREPLWSLDLLRNRRAELKAIKRWNRALLYLVNPRSPTLTDAKRCDFAVQKPLRRFLSSYVVKNKFLKDLIEE